MWLSNFHNASILEKIHTQLNSEVTEVAMFKSRPQSIQTFNNGTSKSNACLRAHFNMLWHSGITLYVGGARSMLKRIYINN